MPNNDVVRDAGAVGGVIPAALEGGARTRPGRPEKSWVLPAGGRGMTLLEVEHAAAKAITAAGIEDALLEAEILLRHVLKLDRAAYFARTNQAITPQQADSYEEVVARRLQREPAAYITGHREFFALEFRVTPDALIPRPETEMLVEATLARIVELEAPLVVDVGAGCGAIAVAVAANHTTVKVVAIDVSPRALGLTRSNAHFTKWSLVSPRCRPISSRASVLGSTSWSPTCPTCAAAIGKRWPQKYTNTSRDWLSTVVPMVYL
jgi:hypothetical protein